MVGLFFFYIRSISVSPFAPLAMPLNEYALWSLGLLPWFYFGLRASKTILQIFGYIVFLCFLQNTEAKPRVEEEKEESNETEKTEDDTEDLEERRPQKRKANAAYGTWTTVEQE